MTVPGSSVARKSKLQHTVIFQPLSNIVFANVPLAKQGTRPSPHFRGREADPNRMGRTAESMCTWNERIWGHFCNQLIDQLSSRGDGCEDEMAPSRSSSVSGAQAGLVMHLGETSQVWPTVGCSRDYGSVGWQPY